MTLTSADSTARTGSRLKLKLRDDDLARVLIDIDGRTGAPLPPRRLRRAGTGRLAIAELRAHVAELTADHERLLDRINEDLNTLADRLTELEARAERPFWRRGFGRGNRRLAATARRRLAERLRSIFSYRRAAKYPSRATL